MWTPTILAQHTKLDGIPIIKGWQKRCPQPLSYQSKALLQFAVQVSELKRKTSNGMVLLKWRPWPVGSGILLGNYLPDFSHWLLFPGGREMGGSALAPNGVWVLWWCCVIHPAALYSHTSRRLGGRGDAVLLLHTCTLICNSKTVTLGGLFISRQQFTNFTLFCK